MTDPTDTAGRGQPADPPALAASWRPPHWVLLLGLIMVTADLTAATVHGDSVLRKGGLLMLTAVMCWVTDRLW